MEKLSSFILVICCVWILLLLLNVKIRRKYQQTVADFKLYRKIRTLTSTKTKNLIIIIITIIIGIIRYALFSFHYMPFNLLFTSVFNRFKHRFFSFSDKKKMKKTDVIQCRRSLLIFGLCEMFERKKQTNQQKKKCVGEQKKAI